MNSQPAAPDTGGRPAPFWRRLVHAVMHGLVLPRTDQERKRAVVEWFALHFRPVRLPTRSLTWTHTFGLGGSALVLVLLLTGTGALMMFGYEPAPGNAYRSIERFQDGTLFGGLVRGVHHWSANLLILVVVLHLLRVFFTGGFHAPRQFNWVIGLGLLVCVLASNFTGYLLPWDQLSYWAITISTGMLSYIPLAGDGLQRAARGGDEIGQATLIVFYSLHTTFIPVALVVLAGFHFWRVRKARGVVVPRAPGEAVDPQPEKVLAVPLLLLRELVQGLILIAVVFTVAALFAAPLGDPANPGMSTNPAKAPWYFMGFQELLLHFHPVVAVLVLPLSAATALVLIPYLRYDDDPSGVWFVSHRGRDLARRAAVAALIATPMLVLVSGWLDPVNRLPAIPAIVTNGLLPMVLLGAALWLGARHLRIQGGATVSETIQTLFVFLGTAFTLLTVIGVWFRTEGMALGWAGW